MEKEIVNIALRNLQEEVPITINWDQNGPLDGELKIEHNHKTFNFSAEIKKEIRPYHIDQILIHRQSNVQIIVIAERISQTVKRELRAHKMAYLEANGNIYIDLPGIFLFVDTKEPYPQKKAKGNRAFTKTGLKVIFNFLLDKELVNRPQREIAAITGVGLGNIPLIINGLKETGYLLQLSKNKYTWENRRELLDRWGTAYETILKPALKIATYTMKEPWQKINLNKPTTVWGGEPAADILTNHLRPGKFIVYTIENQSDLIRNYKFLPKENGELTVYDMFWKQNLSTTTAPPLLVYTELILEGGKRNKETADKIFNEYIKQKL